MIYAVSWKQVWWKLLKMDQKDFSLEISEIQQQPGLYLKWS